MVSAFRNYKLPAALPPFFTELRQAISQHWFERPLGPKLMAASAAGLSLFADSMPLKASAADAASGVGM